MDEPPATGYNGLNWPRFYGPRWPHVVVHGV
jgi:hypothetical protein